MLAEMPAWLFDEWLAFYDLAPWGADADDFRFGQVCAAVGNYAGKERKQDAPWLTPASFFPPRGNSPEGEKEDQELSVAEKLKARWGDPRGS